MPGQRDARKVLDKAGQHGRTLLGGSQRGKADDTVLRVRRNAFGAEEAALSGFPGRFGEREQIGDLGYIGTGMITGRRKPPGRPRPNGDKILNQSISKLRAAVERPIAHLKDWKILATRYRGPLNSLPVIIRTITALAFYKNAPAGT